MTTLRSARRLTAVALLVLPAMLPGQLPTVHTIPRKALGTTDALVLTLPAGRVTVIATNGTDIRYTVQRLPDRPRLPAGGGDTTRISVQGVAWPAHFMADSASLKTLPEYTGKLDEIFSPAAEFYRLAFPSLALTDSQQVEMKRAQATRQTTMPAFVASAPVMAFDLRVEVPRNLRLLSIEVLDTGSVAVQDFAGELNITTGRADVHLGFIAGPTLVETLEGSITATMLNSTPATPVSLMSTRGEIWMEMPRGANAMLMVAGGQTSVSGEGVSSYTKTIRPGEAPGAASRVIMPMMRSQQFGSGGGTVRLRSLDGKVTFRATQPEIYRWPSYRWP